MFYRKKVRVTQRASLHYDFVFYQAYPPFPGKIKFPAGAGKCSIFTLARNKKPRSYCGRKMDILKSVIKKYHSAIIAFSGGVDSTFLASVAVRRLKNGCCS